LSKNKGEKNDVNIYYKRRKECKVRYDVL